VQKSHATVYTTSTKTALQTTMEVALSSSKSKVDDQIRDAASCLVKTLQDITIGTSMQENNLTKNFYFVNIYDRGQLIATQKLVKQ
jgi:hypothetical protein